MRSPPRALHAHPLLPADEPLASLPVVVLDTETTGLNVRRDRIVSLGALQLRGGHPEAVPALDYLVHPGVRSEEHTSELQSLMRISYAVFCLKKKKQAHLYST